VRLVSNAYCFRYLLKREQELTDIILSHRICFFNYHELLFLFEEIFVNETYFIEGRRNSIVDSGSNIGLSILYFKLRDPDAEVTAFEPDPRNAELRGPLCSDRLQ
jgi:hypothetical protein